MSLHLGRVLGLSYCCEQIEALGDCVAADRQVLLC